MPKTRNNFHAIHAPIGPTRLCGGLLAGTKSAKSCGSEREQRHQQQQRRRPQQDADDVIQAVRLRLRCIFPSHARSLRSVIQGGKQELQNRFGLQLDWFGHQNDKCPAPGVGPRQSKRRFQGKPTISPPSLGYAEKCGSMRNNSELTGIQREVFPSTSGKRADNRGLAPIKRAAKRPAGLHATAAR